MEYNNDYNSQEISPVEVAEKRPTGLTVLCILTFIGSGLVMLAYFFSFVLYDMIPGQCLIMAETVGEPMSKSYEMAAELFTSVARASFLLMMVPSLFALLGAITMLNMRKLGFHLYVIGQILVVGLPMLVLKEGFSIGGLLLSLLFVALYAIFFKKMK